MSNLIELLHPTLQRGAIELKRRLQEKGFDMGVSSTYRSNEEQDKIYAQGRTAPGSIITYAKAGQSMHNYRLAFDIFQNIRGKEYDKTFLNLAGQIWVEMGGEWGGSWKSFKDRPHFQFTNSLTLSQLQKGDMVADNAKMKWEPETITPKKQKAKIDEIVRPPIENMAEILIEENHLSKTVKVKTILQDGSNYVNLREIVEALLPDAKIEYDEATKEIKIIVL